jgi:hypothetical protein
MFLWWQWHRKINSGTFFWATECIKAEEMKLWANIYLLNIAVEIKSIKNKFVSFGEKSSWKVTWRLLRIKIGWTMWCIEIRTKLIVLAKTCQHGPWRQRAVWLNCSKMFYCQLVSTSYVTFYFFPYQSIIKISGAKIYGIELSQNIILSKLVSILTCPTIKHVTLHLPPYHPNINDRNDVTQN